MGVWLTLATAISCAMTLVVLYKSTLVVLNWGPGVNTRPRTHSDWLILGVVLNFLASIGDNIWWGIAWYARDLENMDYNFWFDYGVVSNIVFRQGLKIVSAHCHLRAAVAFNAMTPEQFKQVHYNSFVLFVISLACLVVNMFGDYMFLGLAYVTQK